MMSENKPKHAHKIEKTPKLIVKNFSNEHTTEHPIASHAIEPASESHPTTSHHTELKHLIEKYNESVHEVMKQHVENFNHQEIERLHTLTHELRFELMHLENTHHDGQEKENDMHFFHHRLEAINKANEKWLHLLEYTNELFEEWLEEEYEELCELGHRIQLLLEKEEREEYATSEQKNISAPHPELTPHHNNNNKNDTER